MAEITASLVKELRERTGAGMMECKKALVEANGDIELAIENMRKSGAIKAAKKAGNVAADGVIKTKIEGNYGVILEVNCQTDFVAKDGGFQAFADKVLDAAFAGKITDVEALKAQCVANPDVQVVISDGLSTDAITVNYEEILPPLMAGLKQAGLKVGTPFFVRYGRVKIEDQIGEILGAKVVILLVGERPGLGQSESLSCYAVYSPRMATTVEADRTCISNIHQGGTPPVEAAAVIVDLAKRMLEQKASGINMTR